MDGAEAFRGALGYRLPDCEPQQVSVDTFSRMPDNLNYAFEEKRMKRSSLLRRVGSLFVVPLFVLAVMAPAFAVERTLTLSDREILQKFSEQGERIARLEEAVKGLDKHIDGLQNQISELRRTMMAGFGVLFAGMMGLIGFILWDRRTALAPAIRNTEEVRRVLQEYAKKEPKLAEVMKSLGLL